MCDRRLDLAERLTLRQVLDVAVGPRSAGDGRDRPGRDERLALELQIAPDLRGLALLRGEAVGGGPRAPLVDLEPFLAQPVQALLCADF